MTKCYDKRCSNEVEEEFTLCDPCKDRYYPKKKFDNIADKVRSLAANAPLKVSVPQIKILKRSLDKTCSLCEKPKKGAVTVEIGNSGFSICWSHKFTLEQSYGNGWSDHAISMSRQIIERKTGVQSSFIG